MYFYELHEGDDEIFSDDVEADYERMRERGAEFTMAPTKVTGAKIAMLNDTCGNLLQITQLMW